MTTNDREPTRLELYKAGKIEERRSVRPPPVPETQATEPEEIVEGFKLRPEIVAIGLMILVLVILALIGM